MTFSIVIPIYNVAGYLPKCLESISLQTFEDFEVICVDDGSTDDSAAVVEDWINGKGAKVSSRLIRQDNQGLSGARNTGLSVAQGDYVLFIDSDDWIESNTLQILREHLHDEDMLCFNGHRYMEESGEYEDSDVMMEEKQITGWDYYCRHALEHRKFAFVCVVLRCYRREFLLENNLTFKRGIYHEDNLFTPYACYYAQKVSVIPDVLYNYRVRGNSIMTKRSLKHWKDLITSANELSAFFIPRQDIEKTIISQSLTQYYQMAFSNVSSKEGKELRAIVDWNSYRTVSRTKIRHRVQYSALRISPRLFRWVNSRI